MQFQLRIVKHSDSDRIIPLGAITLQEAREESMNWYNRQEQSAKDDVMLSYIETVQIVAMDVCR